VAERAVKPALAQPLVVLFAAWGLSAGTAVAAPPSGDIPLPRPRPGDHIVAAPKHANMHTGGIREIGTPQGALAPPDQLGVTGSIPSSGVLGSDSHRAAALAPPLPQRMPAPQRPAAPLALAQNATTSPLDLAAVKQAIELINKGRLDDATQSESTISDPLARKLVEWVILRNDNADLDFPRLSAFIAANPGWPGVTFLRRRAEAALWQHEADPAAVIAFFRSEPPHSAKGRFALARALLATGDRTAAQAVVRESWHRDSFSADVEAQARGMFAGLIAPADDKARMDARLDLDDDDGGLRAAHQLGGVELAIAKARVAVINKASNAHALLEAVPPDARHDTGLLLSYAQYLRRNDKITEAAQVLARAPRESERLGDSDQWWIERRLVARKLIDLGNFKLAYEIADGAAPPRSDHYRAEQQFTAGWIALRFLREPSTALGHFARIAERATNPITLARSYYWQGRAAEAQGLREARSHYEAAAHYSTAYYGQIARARLGLDAVALHDAPPAPPEARRLEIARAFDILYAVDQRDLAAVMAAEFADKSTDAAALAVLADTAARHGDARATLLIGKPALGHGLPFEHYAFPTFGVPDYQQVGPPVERSVVFSIVRQESAFNPKVVSSANAIGLMQVTPAAGRDTAKKAGLAFDQRRLMADVAYNAQLGTAELGYDIASWRGSYILAFVAYNAGPRRAREWIEQYGDPRDSKIDPIDWIERIPLSETRNYVQRILENMQVYRARIGNDSRLLIEADLHRGG
jgi:soluble lytic murein transglycosylase